MTIVEEPYDLDWEALWAPKQPPPAPVSAPTSHINGNTTKYAQAALNAELDLIGATGPTTENRNDTLNRAAFNLYQLVAAGHLTKPDVDAQLQAAARATGLDDKEIAGTLRSAWNGGQQHPRQVPAPTGAALPSGYELEDATDFWEQREVLTHVRDFAYARMAAPWAVLGVSLLRCLATIPPNVVLPPLIGGHGSLNQFIALVGRSGDGKGVAEATAHDCLDFGEDIYTASVGSGEGIAHQYAHREKGELIRDRDAVLFSVPEVDTLTAIGNRQGSTLLSQLRSAFSGERLGFSYADATRRLPIERHTYRLGMIVGVQPEKAGPIIYDADGGTPQRFIWFPVTDPKVDATAPPAPPKRLIQRQEFPSTYGNVPVVLHVPDSVAKTIRENHAARARGEGNALDGHALFVREKVAQALCFLDGRRTMTEDDWKLSATVMHVSDIHRAGVVADLQKKMDQIDQSRAEREARRNMVISETVTDAATTKLSARLLRHVPEEGIAWHQLRKKLSAKEREHFEEAVHRLEQAGQVAIEGDAAARRIVLTKQSAQHHA